MFLHLLGILAAELQVLKGNLREAQKYYLELVKRNTENLAYYEALERCCGIGKLPLFQLSHSPSLNPSIISFYGNRSSDTIEKKIKFYHKLQEKFPRSALLKRIPLSFLTGEQFRKAVTDYLKRALVKGVPSIFVRLKHFYEDKEKVFASFGHKAYCYLCNIHVSSCLCVCNVGRDTE